MKPSDYPAERYSFEQYNTKHRMLTYWYQIKELLALRPQNLLEIGVGTGLVTSYIRSVGVPVFTVDINDALNPDHVGSVLELTKTFEENSFDVILCARVLHHLKFHDFHQAITELSKVAKRHVILTLPADDFRLYLLFRYTSSQLFTLSIAFSLFLKRLFFRERYETSLRDSSLWKIGDSKKRSFNKVAATIAKEFEILEAYRIPEDRAHCLFVLRTRNSHDR